MNTVEYYRNWRANRELTKLGLSERIVNALGSVGVTTYDQLLQVTVKELEKDVPNIARVSIKSILELVSSKGHKLVGQDEFFNKQNKSKRKWIEMSEADYVLVQQLCKTPIEAAEFVNNLLKGKNL